MLKPPYLTIHTLICLLLLFLVTASAQDLAEAKTPACKVCSTTVMAYKVLTRSTTSFSEYATYSDPSTNVTHVTAGTKTRLRPKMTTTVTVNSTIYATDAPYYFQTRTTTVHVNSTTTKSVCKHTSTPSDYPTPTYCICKSTVTSTKSLPITIGTLGQVTTYATTKTVPPMFYGFTSTSTAIYAVDTYIPTIYYVDFTKTIYKATRTSTLPPYSTPSDLTFQLQAANNPYINEPSYLQFRNHVCINPPFCNEFADILSADGDPSYNSVTNWYITNNTLFNADLPASCEFAPNEGGSEAYNVDCGGTGAVAEVAIDCFGNLVAYTGNADAWGIVSGFLVELFPQPDPVHGFNDAGDSAYVDSPQYVDLKVLPN